MRENLLIEVGRVGRWVVRFRSWGLLLAPEGFDLDVWRLASGMEIILVCQRQQTRQFPSCLKQDSNAENVTITSAPFDTLSTYDWIGI